MPDYQNISPSIKSILEQHNAGHHKKVCQNKKVSFLEEIGFVRNRMTLISC